MRKSKLMLFVAVILLVVITACETSDDVGILHLDEPLPEIELVDSSSGVTDDEITEAEKAAAEKAAAEKAAAEKAAAEKAAAEKAAAEKAAAEKAAAEKAAAEKAAAEKAAAEKAAAEKAAAEKAAAEKAAAEKAAAEKAAAEKAAAEKAAAEKAAAEKAAAEKAAAEKAAAEKAAAEKAAAEKAAAEKAAAEKAASEQIVFEEYPLAFYRNTHVTIKIKAKPYTPYKLDIEYKSGLSSASGLGEKVSDSEGYVSWTFKVGGNTTEGYYPKIIITGNDETVVKEFVVEEELENNNSNVSGGSTSDQSPEQGTTETSGGITLIQFSEEYVRNEVVTITIKAAPNTEYNLRVKYKSGWSKASGLCVKMSDSEGYVSWTFKIGGKSTEGYSPLIEISGNGETLTRYFTVVED